MARISKELNELNNLLNDVEKIDENNLERLNLDFMIDYIYENEFFLDDARHPSYSIHSLEEILLIVIFALLTNCNTYKEIELFIKIHTDWLKSKLNLIFGIPSISTIRRVIAIIKPKDLELLCNNIFFHYVKKDNEIYNLNNLIIKDIYSLDGKVINGSEVSTSHGVVKKINAMSAYSIKYNKSVATEFIDSKTNEIPTCPKLLSRFDIKDSVITFDALNTQSKTIKYIIENKAHYVAPIKDNHKDFSDDLLTYFRDDSFLVECNKYESIEKAHNKMEKREYFFTNNTNWIVEREKWSKLKSIGYLRKYIDNKLVEERVFISDLDAINVEFIAKVIRCEWHIENNLHWYLDTSFKEDNNKCYIMNSQKNLNIIRKFCLGIIKQVKDKLYNESVNSTRQILTMSFEKEIERVFDSLQ